MRNKWLLYSVGGLLLCGLGLCLFGEAIIFKINNDFNWFYLGTIALVIFNSGICLIAEATLLLGKIRITKLNSQ